PMLTAGQAAVLELQRRGAASGIIAGPTAGPATGPATGPVAGPVAGQMARPSDGAGPQAVHVVSVGGPAAAPEMDPGPAPAPGPYLVVPLEPGAQLGTVLADTARTLAVCWRLEEAERDRDRLRSAEGHSREAVLHLLMAGDVPTAHRIAAALPPE